MYNCCFLLLNASKRGKPHFPHRKGPCHISWPLEGINWRGMSHLCQEAIHDPPWAGICSEHQADPFLCEAQIMSPPLAWTRKTTPSSHCQIWPNVLCMRLDKIRKLFFWLRTLSGLSTSRLRWGAHTWTQFSKCGFTNAVEKGTSNCIDAIF